MQHPPDSTPPSPQPPSWEDHGETAIAFRWHRTLGIQNDVPSRCNATARTLACLRFADLVTEIVGRLASGLGFTRRLRLLPPLAGGIRTGRTINDISRRHRISSCYSNRLAMLGRTESPTGFT